MKSTKKGQDDNNISIMMKSNWIPAMLQTLTYKLHQTAWKCEM